MNQEIASHQKRNLIDSHCHLDMILEKGIPVEQLRQNNLDAGLTAAIHIASDRAGRLFVQDQLLKNPIDLGCPVFYTVGCHPSDVHLEDPGEGIEFARLHRDQPGFVAIGEVGLDYYRSDEHRQIQINALEKYLNLAAELNRPVCLHTRNAHDDTLQLLRADGNRSRKLIHCFTGSRKEMEQYLEEGAFISFSGIATFQNAHEVREAAMACPSDRLLVETDAPFLAPVPHRGKPNQPGWVSHTLQFLTNLRSEQDLPLKVFQNTCTFFNITFQ